MYIPARKYNIDQLLSISSPELYDLKDEMGYKGNDLLEKILNYKNAQDGFECDGVASGKYYCILIREIYSLLWGWNGFGPRGGVKRYDKTCLGDGIDMGPETMNSFATTYGCYKEVGMECKEDIEVLASSVGRIGNMTLTYKGKNRYVACDYWDLKLREQYLNNISLTADEKKEFINLFFQWDYVGTKDGSYIFKPFWNGHEYPELLPKHDQIVSYIKTIDHYTKRRGLFMVEMMRIAKEYPDDYDLLRKKVLMVPRVYCGYADVINNMCAQRGIKEKVLSILTILENKLECCS